jgi:hypothetical protein
VVLLASLKVEKSPSRPITHSLDKQVVAIQKVLSDLKMKTIFLEMNSELTSTPEAAAAVQLYYDHKVI